ncbi:MAG: hypothetical protein KF691_10375 [Phycisphaeraceae bacterium]|nr:hypothetical protein [Phycisphaeraceae bacterium]
MRRTWCAMIVLCGCTALALEAAAQSPFSPGFTYQGRLQSGGRGVVTPTRAYFRLYDVATGGSQIGSTFSTILSPDAAGAFTVELNTAAEYGSAAFTGGSRFLEIEIDAAGGNVVLSPRVSLSPVPHAITASSLGSRLPGAASPLVNIDPQDRLGIGTTSPQADLDLKGNMYVDPSGFGGAPTITFAVGDTDTGLNWGSDGQLSIFANAIEYFRIDPAGPVKLRAPDGASGSFLANGGPGTSMEITAGNGGTGGTLKNGGNGGVLTLTAGAGGAGGLGGQSGFLGWVRVTNPTTTPFFALILRACRSRQSSTSQRAAPSSGAAAWTRAGTIT